MEYVQKNPRYARFEWNFYILYSTCILVFSMENSWNRKSKIPFHGIPIFSYSVPWNATLPRTRGVRQGCVRTSTYDVKYHAKSGEISKLLFLQKVLDVSRSHFNSDMALC